MIYKFKKFEPLNENAKIKINELISKGGNLIVDKKDFVEIQRYQSIAKIDNQGRVEWRPS
jgi:hypothetical protein